VLDDVMDEFDLRVEPTDKCVLFIFLIGFKNLRFSYQRHRLAVVVDFPPAAFGV
jgi:hypothetical protein